MTQHNKSQEEYHVHRSPPCHIVIMLSE